jgi:hypothetical protein
MAKQRKGNTSSAPNPRDQHGIVVGKKVPSGGGKPDRNLRKASSGMRRMMSLSAASNRRSKSAAKSGLKVYSKRATQSQRVAVRITYVKAKTAGHWKAHGSYLQREAAAGKGHTGFNGAAEHIDIPVQLDSWQGAGDARLFKVIISPEQGHKLDLMAYTREVMSKVELDAMTKLEWVAVIHRNTDHPHVHVAIRGVKSDGTELTFDREYIKEGFRTRAQEKATQILGLRSPEDVETSMLQEVTKGSVTSLDRFIQKNALAIPEDNALVLDMHSPAVQQYGKRDVSRLFAIERRLYHLRDLGLATRGSDERWQLPNDYMTTLRSLALAGDKQKMLLRHMEPASSVGQSIASAKWSDVRHMEARILGHSEDEATGKRFMLLERLDGTILHLPHRADTEVLRAQKKLAKNQVITITRTRGRLVFIEHGNAEKLLADPAALSQLSGVQPIAANRPGWLGRLDAAAADLPLRGHYEQQPAHQPPPSTVAIRLTANQLDSLLQQKYPNSEYFALLQIKSAIHDPEQHVTLTDRNIEIQYSQTTDTYFAEVTVQDKQYLDAQLAKLSALKRRRQDRQRDIERD